MKILYQKDKIAVLSTLKNNSSIIAKFKKLPFDKIKNDILGREYDLSVVLTGKARIKALNFKYRKKNCSTDVLSFEISPNVMGEIFVCPEIASKKTKKIDPSSDFASFKLHKLENYMLFLVIHAIFHLKGMEHGSKMSEYEFAHYSRYRYRYL